jgi:hypothetical protein
MRTSAARARAHSHRIGQPLPPAFHQVTVIEPRLLAAVLQLTAGCGHAIGKAVRVGDEVAKTRWCWGEAVVVTNGGLHRAVSLPHVQVDVGGDRSKAVALHVATRWGRATQEDKAHGALFLLGEIHQEGGELPGSGVEDVFRWQLRLRGVADVCLGGCSSSVRSFR